VNKYRVPCMYIFFIFHRPKLRFPFPSLPPSLPPNLPSSEGWTPGGVREGGKRIHFFRPFSTAFQAAVALGS